MKNAFFFICFFFVSIGLWSSCEKNNEIFKYSDSSVNVIDSIFFYRQGGDTTLFVCSVDIWSIPFYNIIIGNDTVLQKNSLIYPDYKVPEGLINQYQDTVKGDFYSIIKHRDLLNGTGIQINMAENLMKIKREIHIYIVTSSMKEYKILVCQHY